MLLVELRAKLAQRSHLSYIILHALLLIVPELQALGRVINLRHIQMANIFLVVLERLRVDRLVGRDQVSALLGRVFCIHLLLSFYDARRQHEFEHYALLVVEKAHKIQILRVMRLLEDELVVRNVPVCYRMLERPFEEHLPFEVPDLEQEREALVPLYDLLVDDLDQDGAEARILVEVAAGKHLVELVERDGVHDALHEVFRRLVLLVFQLVLTVLFPYLGKRRAFHDEVLRLRKKIDRVLQQVLHAALDAAQER